MTNQPYQLMPPLTAEEYAALRDDIKTNAAVLVPVVRDQHGNIIDGHHRAQAAEELGIHCPTEVIEVRDDEHARSLARAFNLARRHLTREQKRQLIAQEITAYPDDSDRAIARRMHCDHKTVGSVRRELRGELPHPVGTLTAGQSRKVETLVQIMRSRTLDFCARVQAGEPVFAYTLQNSFETEDFDVAKEASARHLAWAIGAEETRGVLWDWADEEKAA